jgi:hypothetical protein
VESCKLRYFNSFEFFDLWGVRVLSGETGSSSAGLDALGGKPIKP